MGEALPPRTDRRCEHKSAASSGSQVAQQPDWATAARLLPVAFAQVREDASQDLWLADRVSGRELLRIVMIASGGCTAAALANLPAAGSIHLVDVNSAQLALARLKLHMLRTTGVRDRLELLGHMPVPRLKREARLSSMLRALDLPADALGPAVIVAEAGPDFCGRYEWLFAALRRCLTPWRDELGDVLRLRDPAEQSRRTDPATGLGQALDEAFDKTFDLGTLVYLFGANATANPAEPFARHFARRTRQVLATMPAARNPYLWQMLAGHYPVGASAPWLTAAAATKAGPEITWEQNTIADALAAAERRFDMVHLSNILDWLTPEQAGLTLQNAWRALRPGGIVIVRQLNSALDIRACGGRFRWDPVSEQLHARDRSFFYRALHVGVKP